MAPSPASTFVTDWMRAESPAAKEECVNNLVKDWSNGITLQTFLQALQPYLEEDATLTDAQQGLELVSQVLMKDVQLSKHDLNHLVTYLDTRLTRSNNDIPSYRAGLKEIAAALTSLVERPSLSFIPSQGALICSSVFGLAHEAFFKSQVAATRLAFYILIDSVYQRPNIRWEHIGEKFVDGLVTLAEFEKDPACLKVLWGLYTRIGHDLKATLREEDCKKMFESSARYFPLTMSTPKDSSKPHPGELRNLLGLSWASNDHYAQWTFQRLIDTMDGDLKADTKNSIFVTMKYCIKNYSISALDPWAVRIWDALKHEIWWSENSDFVDGALDVVKSLAYAYGQEDTIWNGVGNPITWTNDDNLMAVLIDRISKECAAQIYNQEDNYRFSQSSARIIGSVAASSPYAFHLVIKRVLPGLLTNLQGETELVRQAALLESVNGLLQARIDVVDATEKEIAEGGKGADAPDPKAPKFLDNLRDAIDTMRSSLELFSTGLLDPYMKAIATTPSGTKEIAHRLATIRGISLLLTIPDLIRDPERSTLITALCQEILERDADDRVRELAADCLAKIHTQDQIRFGDITLPAFLVELPSKISENQQQSAVEEERIVSVLEDLVTVAVSKPYDVKDSKGVPATELLRNFESLQSALTNKLFEVSQAPQQTDYINILLATIYAGLDVFDKSMTILDSIQDVHQGVHPYTEFLTKLIDPIIERRQNVGSQSRYIGLKCTHDGKPLLADSSIRMIGRILTRALASTVNRRAVSLDEGKKSTAATDSAVRLNEHFLNLFTVLENQTDQDQTIQTQQRPGTVTGTSDMFSVNILYTALIAGIDPTDMRHSSFNLKAGMTASAMISNAIDTTSQASSEARYAMLQSMQLLVNKFGAAREDLATNQLSKRTLSDDVRSRVSNVPTDDIKEANSIYQTVAFFAAAALACFDPCAADLVALMLEAVDGTPLGQRVARGYRFLLGPSEVLHESAYCVVKGLRFGKLYSLIVPKLLDRWRSSEDTTTKDNCLIALLGVLEFMPASIIKQHEEDFFLIALAGCSVPDATAKSAAIKIIKKLVTTADAPLVQQYLDSIINRMTDRTHNTLDSPSDSTIESRVEALEVLTLLLKHVDAAELARRRSRVLAEMDFAVDDCSRQVRRRAQNCKRSWLDLAEVQVVEDAHAGHNH